MAAATSGKAAYVDRIAGDDGSPAGANDAVEPPAVWARFGQRLPRVPSIEEDGASPAA